MKKIHSKYIIVSMGLMLCCFVTSFSQNKKQQNQTENQAEKQDTRRVVRAVIIDGDTIPLVELGEVIVIPPWKFKNNKEQVTYTKLARNVKIALPYARTASAKLYEINSNLEKIKDDKGRKKYLKQAEKDLFAEFEAPIRNLTFTQGKILIKLIDRETGNTGYELVKQYRGNVSAFFWQGIARLFGANLKDVYKPDYEDAMIEHIIKMIDAGLM